MTKKDLAYITENRKWPESWKNRSHFLGGGLIMRYFSFASLIFLLCLIFLIEKKILIDDEWFNHKQAIPVAGIAGAFALLIMVALFKSRKYQNRFIKIKTNRPYAAKEILLITRKLNWVGTINANNTLALEDRLFYYSVRHQINIIILNDHQLLFNSYNSALMTLVNRNARNLENFLAQIDGAVVDD